MNELLAFLFAAVISFWGSLQLGPVNVCVIETALSYGKRQALIVAFGGILPELIYSTLAVFGANWLVQYPQFTLIFGWIIVLLLFSLGIYYLLKPYKPAVLKPSSGAGFAKGFFLALFNPQLLPFWLGVLVYMRGFINFKEGTLFSPYISFVIGTSVGAWLLLYMFTKLAVAYQDKLKKLLKSNMNKVVGCLFIILAVAELIRRII